MSERGVNTQVNALWTCLLDILSLVAVISFALWNVIVGQWRSEKWSLWVRETVKPICVMQTFPIEALRSSNQQLLMNFELSVECKDDYPGRSIPTWRFGQASCHETLCRHCLWNIKCTFWLIGTYTPPWKCLRICLAKCLTKVTY
jgi:hypothetical protein